MEMEIWGYGLRFSPRTDGPTVMWQTLAPAGTELPRMLNIGFRDGATFRWGTVVPFLKSNQPTLPREVKLVSLGGQGASMLLNNASDVEQIVRVHEAANSGVWWIRSTQSPNIGLDVPWVPTFFIETTPPGSHWSFELKGPLADVSVLEGAGGIGPVLRAFDSVPANALILVRGPVPAAGGSVDAMVARMPAGNTVVGRGHAGDREWVESASHGEHGRTLQRHYVCDVGASENIVVTGQAPPDRMNEVRDYAELIATKMGIQRQ